MGVNKAVAMAQLIRMIRPDCQVLTMGEFTTAIADQIGLASEANYIVATTDTWRSRKMVHEWAHAQGIIYLECAAEGDTGSVTSSPADWATPEEEMPGYASVPVWSAPSIQAALLAANFILHGNVDALRGRNIRIGWDKDHDFQVFDSRESEEVYVESETEQGTQGNRLLAGTQGNRLLAQFPDGTTIPA